MYEVYVWSYKEYEDMNMKNMYEVCMKNMYESYVEYEDRNCMKNMYEVMKNMKTWIVWRICMKLLYETCIVWRICMKLWWIWH